MSHTNKFFKLFRASPEKEKKSPIIERSDNDIDSSSKSQGMERSSTDADSKKKSHFFKVKSLQATAKVNESTNQCTLIENCDKIRGLEETIKLKDIEITRLNKELEKLRTYLRGPCHSETLRQINQKNINASSESSSESPKKYPKDSSVFKKILGILSENVYMNSLDKDRLIEVVNVMYIKEFNKGETIIKEGESGDCLFIVESGELELSKSDEIIGNLGAGKVFGEHSFLYNCARATNVKALTDVKLWVLDKSIFETIILKTMLAKQKEHMDLLKRVPLFYNIPDHNLSKIIDILKEIHYKEFQFIFRQGDKGDCLYIIKQGNVEFTRRPSNDSEPVFIKILNQGSFFGEKSLLGEEIYLNDARAGQTGCTLIQIEREAFSTFIGNVSGVRFEFKGDDVKVTQNDIAPYGCFDNQLSISSNATTDRISQLSVTNKFDTSRRLTLDDLNTMSTLGRGNFSRIELVVLKSDNRVTYALKQIKKRNIVSLNLQQQFLNERKILLEINCSFIVKLFKTFKDRKYIYFLLEPCLGGTLNTLIREKQTFPENWVKFYIGCIIESIRYLHKSGIMYRDLKPSNIFIDDRGYAKLSNFSYAKRIVPGRRTFSFCGTPEYVAPEVILNKGHDFSVDLWGIGVVIYEMFVGKPPFIGADPIKTYNLIMRGFDTPGFPNSIPRVTQMLIRKLCRLSPYERIGYGKNNLGDIQKHKWFDGFNWVNLRNMVTNPPFVPNKAVTSESYDTEEDYLADDDIPPDEVSGWDKEF